MVLTNVLGCAYTIRATMPALKESVGHLLLTSSVAGRRALPGSLYTAHEVRRHGDGRGRAPGAQRQGVRVTSIEPGMVDTPFFDNPVSDALSPTTSPARSCSPCPSRRTSTSTRSSSGR